MTSSSRSLSAGASTHASHQQHDSDHTLRNSQPRIRPEIPLPPSRTIEERYRVLSRVGDGGMGVVFRAHDERLHREVALKIIRPDLAEDRELVDQFLAEARAMAQLRHANVVEVYDFGQHQTLPYFVMRFIDGPDLHRWVNAQPLPLPVDVALGLLGQICEGIAAIHDAGVVHRDIKPENILVDHGFRAVVTDFGLVRSMDHGTMTATYQIAGGTASYMAPELVREDDMSPELATRADVYALGIMAYWLLVGRHPFKAKNRKQMLDLQIRARVSPPSVIRPDLAPVLDPVILGALHKDPSRRIPNARVLVDQLRRARETLGHPDACIVLVDDDSSSLEWIRDTLNECIPHARLICMPDSRQALASITQERPSLVITALENEGVSGLELAATLRGNPTTAAVPVVVTSAAGGAAEWQALWRIGVQGFMLKPLIRESLVPMVQGLLPKYRSVTPPQGLRKMSPFAG